METVTLTGVVRKGHQIASGMSPTGKDGLNFTVGLQKPFFEKAGVPGISDMFIGTINMTIAPGSYQLTKPDFEITCQWHPGVIETFWLNKVKIIHRGNEFYGYHYYPVPTPGGPQEKEIGVIELLAPKITGLVYGDQIAIKVEQSKIKIII